MPERTPMTLPVAFPSAVPRSLTGNVERRLGAALSGALPRPDSVSQVLEAVFARIGGVASSREIIERLSTGARAWLLTRAALRFLPGSQWFQARCGACGAGYDLELSLADLPRGARTQDFPVVRVTTSRGLRRFEVPNGYTEAALARTGAKDAPRALARLTGLSRDAEADADAFTEDDLARIDDALDAATPDMSEQVITQCPACASQTTAHIDPLQFAFPRPATLERDTHLIASAYHWSEPAIHALPSQRRRRYAQMISEKRSVR